jgi:hypothetical protein
LSSESLIFIGFQILTVPSAIPPAIRPIRKLLDNVSVPDVQPMLEKRLVVLTHPTMAGFEIISGVVIRRLNNSS